MVVVQSVLAGRARIMRRICAPVSQAGSSQDFKGFHGIIYIINTIFSTNNHNFMLLPKRISLAKGSQDFKGLDRLIIFIVSTFNPIHLYKKNNH